MQATVPSACLSNIAPQDKDIQQALSPKTRKNSARQKGQKRAASRHDQRRRYCRGEGRDEKADQEVPDIDWTDTLTWSLVSAVTSDDAIRKGLYPEPGANASTKNGGGAKKTEHH
ncbi:hypothetical protein BDR07DRAFT_1351646 [Suillus spraguei]|nr:hypothetical protein BDR07DRAFT_1351646 [Suillus spraguei]